METQLVLKQLKDKLESLLFDINRLIINGMQGDERVEKTIAVVLNYAGLSMADLIESRKGGLIFYKRILCYILHDFCSVTYQKIANKINLKSHATARHHTEKMRWWLANPQYADKETIMATNNILKELGYEK